MSYQESSSGNSLLTSKVPSSSDSEKSILAASILDEKSLHIAVSLLQEDDFYEPRNRIIFQAILDLYQKSRAVDLVTVFEQLESKQLAEKIGGMAYLTELQQQPYLLKHASEYAKIVHEKAILRKLIYSLTEVVDLCRESDESASSLLDLCSQRLLELYDDRNSEMENIQDILQRQLTDWVNPQPKNRALSTGFGKLDQSIGGLRPGTLTLLAARPAMGKSALALNLATTAALQEEQTVVVFSLEMSKEELATRVLASFASVETSMLKPNHLNDQVFEQVTAAFTRLKGTKLFIDDRSGTNPTEMLSKCRQLKMQQGLGLVIIDYLQLMNGRGRENRQQEISEISRSLKLMAKELKVPVIALSQLSRACEARENKRPLLSDLRESGSLEQDADVVLFLFREAYYKKENQPQEQEITELIIAKNRAGSTGTVELGWIPRFTRFYDLGTQKYEDPQPKIRSPFTLSNEPGKEDFLPLRKSESIVTTSTVNRNETGLEDSEQLSSTTLMDSDLPPPLSCDWDDLPPPLPDEPF